MTLDKLPYLGQPQKYFDRPMSFAGGWGAIAVEVKTLESVLLPDVVYDLIDMDIQGTEADLIEANLDLLNHRVKRLHIATHYHEVEDRLRKALSGQSWRLTWDFPCATDNYETPYGPINFCDGVQSWHNPRFSG